MFRNYFLISLRNLKKNLSYSVINISGLALGVATCLLLVSWIRHELSYDRFHKKAERIYRVSLEYSFGGQVARTSVSPNALLPALLALPETESGVRVYNPSQQSAYIVKYGREMYEESKFYFADSTFFDVFSFDLILGNPKKALAEPYSLILTERMAAKYFGGEDPIGKTLSINNQQDYKVTGIMKDVPSNSLMQIDFVASFSSIPAGRDHPTWWSANYQTFVLIHPSAHVQALADKLNVIAKEAVGAELTGENDYARYNFLPLTDIYLHSDFEEDESVSDIQYVYIFSVVAILILLIACINYINLSTARAASRAKEVGIRKVTGALRKQLFTQFLSESFVITAFSFVLAMLMALVMLPLFNSLTGKDFTYNSLLEGKFILLSLAGVVVIGFVAGVYPAMALTSFNPAKVLKGTFQTSGSGIWLRKSLVVFQFGISVLLVAGTLIIMKQLDFIRNKKLGFDRENTLILPLDKKTEKVYESLKSELKRSGAAIYVGRGSESPSHVRAGFGMNTTEKNGPGIIITGLLTDEEYIPALGIALAAGRNFTDNDVARLTRDSIYSFILNEAALSALYIRPTEAIGRKVSLQGQEGEIIGIVKDFHFSSLHNAVGPLVMFPQERFRKIFVKLPAGNISESVEKVRQVCGEIITHRPFEYQFLDQQYNSLYRAEERMGSVALVFATLAIIIACLGLFGLVSFSAEQKRKEIGIRKVLGATVSGIVFLITRDFSKLIIIAIGIGLPLSYWILSSFWLSEFAYKTEIGYTPFLIAASACISIALGATGYQVLKASRVNPYETLRSE